MMKNFIIQVNSREESLKLGEFLRNINIDTQGYAVDSAGKDEAYIIENNKITYLTSKWGGRFSHLRLFQNLDELKNYFRNQEMLSNNYEIY